MTKVATITYSKEQAAELVGYYNSVSRHSLTADQAHLIFHDNSDEEMTDTGRTHIEVGGFDREDGIPFSYEITADEVTLEWQEV